MTAVEHAHLTGLDLYDELRAAVDVRTLEIVERRRRGGIVKTRGWLVRRVLLAADVVGLTAALALAEWLVNRRSSIGVLGTRDEVIAFLLSLPGWVVVAKLYGLYDRDAERPDHSTVDELASVFHMVTVCTFLFWAFAYVTSVAHPTPPKLLVFWVSAVALISMSRAGGRAIARRSAAYLQNTLIVGDGDVGQLVARKLLDHPEYGMNLVGFVDAQAMERRSELEHLAFLGDTSRLTAIVSLFDIERAIVAFSSDSHQEMLHLVRELRGLDVQIDVVPRFYEVVAPGVAIHTLEGLPLVGLPLGRPSRSSAFLKRSMDIALSTAGVILLAPLLILIAAAVKLDSAGPIIYRHERVGRNRRCIHVLKFRTMFREACRGTHYGGAHAEAVFAALMGDADREEEFSRTQKLAKDPRVTRVGRLLRKTSLDELPQLLNVLAGDISLVGPRPVTTAELARYGSHADDLVSIRPGVTGYWQINGRSRLSYEDRMQLDLAYIAGWSLRLDLEILAKTLRVVLTRRHAV